MPLSRSQLETIERNIESILSRQKVPGAGVGLIVDGQPAYARGFGQASLERQEPVTPQTVFRIASISKVVTAVGVMQLVEKGLVRLDDPANMHLTSFKIQPYRPGTPPVTIRHLLTHTSGLGELAPLLSYLHPGAFFGMARAGRPLLPLGRFYGRRLRPDSPPGAKWAYANHGFAALGQLIADVRGQHFADAMEGSIFGPLGMGRSDFLRRPKVLDGLAPGYRLRGDRPRKVPEFDILTMADGSLFTTVEDFGQFAGALARGGGPLLSEATTNQMFRPHFQLDHRLPAFGLGFFLENRLSWNGQLVVQHDGAWLGFSTAFYLAPRLGLAAYAFTNTNASAAVNIAYSAIRTLVPDDDPQFPLTAEPRPNLWPELAGRYRPAPGLNSNARLWFTFGGQLEVLARDGQLWLKSRLGDWRQPAPLTPADPNDPLALVAHRTPILFKRNAAGQVDRLQMRYQEFFKQ